MIFRTENVQIMQVTLVSRLIFRLCHSAASWGVQAYAAHPEHVKVINDLIKPIMEPGSRAAIQYER